MIESGERGCMNEKSGLSFHSRLILEMPVTNIDRAARRAR